MTDEDDLKAERAARPDFDVVSRYMEGERQIIAELVRHGYNVLQELNGYSVQLTGRQKAIFTLTDEGAFRWGWVEVPGGRIDLRDKADFMRELTFNTDR